MPTSDIQTRLYLDVDGAINADEPPFSEVKSTRVQIEYGGGMMSRMPLTWAPEVVAELDALRDEFSLELVWLSTWNEMHASMTSLAPALGGLFGGRAIMDVDAVSVDRGRGWWKAQSIIADQELTSAPFIWVDDEAVMAHGGMVDDATVGTPSLKLTTVYEHGIERLHLAQMRSFLAEQAQRQAVLR
ncbi:HAD domain-containing protein [Paramicrobacterium fandaimingii]|uniref:HAD domain-containing protein n=1 Tax=Paramicrobacterium fandaimingii TaxID=2708079 RepID=UPI00141DB53F|nr:HAD domain-containing protein [Microbacterium fandaimingii]